MFSIPDFSIFISYSIVFDYFVINPYNYNRIVMILERGPVEGFGEIFSYQFTGRVTHYYHVSRSNFIGCIKVSDVDVSCFLCIVFSPSALRQMMLVLSCCSTDGFAPSFLMIDLIGKFTTCCPIKKLTSITKFIASFTPMISATVELVELTFCCSIERIFYFKNHIYKVSYINYCIGHLSANI